MKKQGYILLSILVLLISITHINWISTNNMLFSWDFPYWFDDYVQSFFPYGFGTWTTYTNFGYYNIQPYLNGFLSIWGLIGDYDLAIRITILFPILILQLVGSILFLKKIFNENTITFPVFVGTLYIIFNTYFLYTSFSHLFILFGASILPLLIYVYIRYLESQNIKNAIILSVVFTISCIYEFRIALINFIVLLIFSFYYSELFFRLLRNYKSLLLVIGMIFFLNFFWIITLFVGDFSSEADKVIYRGVFGNKFANIIYGLTGYKPYWDMWGDSKDFTLREIPMFIYLSTLFVIVPAFFPNNRRIFLLSIGLILLSAFLLKQDAAPFVGSYTWLYDNVPLFSIFREGSKFSIFSVLGYSIGFIIFLNTVKIYAPKRIYVLISALLIVIILLPAQSLFFQKGRYTYEKREYNEDYAQLNNEILDSNDFYKTLSVPTKSKLLTYSSKNPSVIFASSEIFSLFNEIPQTDVYENFTSKANRLFSHPNFHNFLTLGGIRYIILNYEDIENQDNTFFWYGKRDDFKEILDNNLTYLSRSKIGDIEIFENTGYASPIFITKNLVTNINYSGSIHNVKVDSFYNLVGYNFTILKGKEAIYLNFSQVNNRDWYLSFDYQNEGFGSSDCRGIGQKVESLKFLNSWKISFESIRDYVDLCYGDELRNDNYPKKLSDGRLSYKYYIENLDGSIDVSLSLYFRPQLYLKFGLIVSSITFLLLFIVLIGSIIHGMMHMKRNIRTKSKLGETKNRK